MRTWEKLWAQLKEYREPRSWVLEEYSPVEGQVYAYTHEATDTMQSEVVSKWVHRFGPSTLEECRREREKFNDDLTAGWMRGHGRFLLALPSNGSDAADEVREPNGDGKGNGLDHGHVEVAVPSSFPAS